MKDHYLKKKTISNQPSKVNKILATESKEQRRSTLTGNPKELTNIGQSFMLIWCQ